MRSPTERGQEGAEPREVTEAGLQPAITAGLKACTTIDSKHRLNAQCDSEKRVGLHARTGQLETARQASFRDAAGQRNRRVARQVEELRQPQHEIPDRLFRRADAHAIRADRRSGSTQSGKL